MPNYIVHTITYCTRPHSSGQPIEVLTVSSAFDDFSLSAGYDIEGGTSCSVSQAFANIFGAIDANHDGKVTIRPWRSLAPVDRPRVHSHRR